jgi:hypothetical protein
MKGGTMLATLQRLSVIPSFSRPSVSDDNPFSCDNNLDSYRALPMAGSHARVAAANGSRCSPSRTAVGSFT